MSVPFYGIVGRIATCDKCGAIWDTTFIGDACPGCLATTDTLETITTDGYKVSEKREPNRSKLGKLAALLLHGS